MVLAKDAHQHFPPEAKVSASEALAPLQDGRELVIEALCAGRYFTARRRGEKLDITPSSGDDLGVGTQRVIEALGTLSEGDFFVEGVVNDDQVLLTDLMEFDGVDWSLRPLRDRLAELGEISPVALMRERTTTDMQAMGLVFLDHLKSRGAPGALVRDPDAPRAAGASEGKIVVWG